MGSFPTWIWSRFSFNELNFLSSVDFGLVLDVMGDFSTGDKGLWVIYVFLAQDIQGIL